MPLLSLLDRKFWSTLLDIDGKLENIDGRISLTNGKINELSIEVRDNTERIIMLEANFENSKENSKLQIENTILKILQSQGGRVNPKQLSK